MTRVSTLIAAVLISGAAAAADDYPVRPVRIVTSEAGGGNDVQARVVARGLSASLGQQVIVENRPSGVIPGDIVAKAQPNGYTLLLYNNTLWIGPLLQKTPYDPLKDFAPITVVARGPNVLVVSAALPVKSVAELVALARAKPGALNYASSGVGASNHLAAELFKFMAGVDIVRIGYKGAAQGLNDVIAGQVQVMFPTAGAAAAIVKSGKVRGLAVTSAEPSPLIPGLPTVAAAGLPGYESIAIYGMFAPAGTPRALVSRLHAEIARVLEAPEARSLFVKLGMEVVASSPAELTATLKSEMGRMTQVIKAAGIRSE